MKTYILQHGFSGPVSILFKEVTPTLTHHSKVGHIYVSKREGGDSEEWFKDYNDYSVGWTHPQLD